MNGSSKPQKKIGGYLKQKRERLNESVAEVSYAVEIDIELLNRIENGQELPSEDILILLLSHFNVEEKVARKILELAGYDLGAVSTSASPEDQLKQQVFMLMPGNQVMYTDQVNIQPSKNGVILNIMQPGMGESAIPISRVGLTREQAEELINDLRDNLANKSTAPKLLPRKTTR